ADHDHRHVAERIERRGVAEQDEVGARALRKRERLATVVCAEHVEAVACEMPLEENTNAELWLCDEDGGHHANLPRGSHAEQMSIRAISCRTIHSRLPGTSRD